MENRIKEIRNYLGLNQRDFAAKINVGASTLAMFETGKRIPKDIHINQICSSFNVNEEWLRTGKGDMFLNKELVTLDDYATSRNLSALELDIMRAYMDLDENTREQIISHLVNALRKHVPISNVPVITDENRDVISHEIAMAQVEQQTSQSETSTSIDLKKAL